jgi:hypothetical protein
MKTVRKALLATAVAAALSPAAVMADTTLFGNFDISVGFESGAESAIAVDDSPAGDNVIGVEGSLDLENGNAVTYQYIANIDLDADSGTAFGANYHSYIGYKTDSMEVRAGNQDLPLRMALDKADNFAGTHADANNVVESNTTAPSSVMVLGGTDVIKYAVSLDTRNGNTGAVNTNSGTALTTTVGENSNNKDANDAIRIGAMADFSVNENVSIAVGYESLKDSYDAYGLSANIGLTDSAELTLAYNQVAPDANGAAEPSSILVGGSFGLNDTTTLKAQVGIRDLDVAGSDDPTYYAIGADFALAENVTTYVLYAGATDFGNGATVLGTVEGDAKGDGDVLAGGIKLSF